MADEEEYVRIIGGHHIPAMLKVMDEKDVRTSGEYGSPIPAMQIVMDYDKRGAPILNMQPVSNPQTGTGNQGGGSGNQGSGGGSNPAGGNKKP